MPPCTVNTIFPVPELWKSTFEHGHVDRRMKGRSRVRFTLELEPTEGSLRFSQVINGIVQLLPILFHSARLSEALQGSPRFSKVRQRTHSSLKFAKVR